MTECWDKLFDIQIINYDGGMLLAERGTLKGVKNLCVYSEHKDTLHPSCSWFPYSSNVSICSILFFSVGINGYHSLTQEKVRELKQDT